MTLVRASHGCCSTTRQSLWNHSRHTGRLVSSAKNSIAGRRHAADMANIHTPIPNLRLNDGTSIPMLAYGTGTAWYKSGDESKLDQNCIDSAKSAVKLGYRHLDGAEVYKTETELGVVIKDSGVARDKLYVVTKVLPNIADIPAALKTSLKKLKVDYVDLSVLPVVLTRSCLRERQLPHPCPVLQRQEGGPSGEMEADGGGQGAGSGKVHRRQQLSPRETRLDSRDSHRPPGDQSGRIPPLPAASRPAQIPQGESMSIPSRHRPDW